MSLLKNNASILIPIIRKMMPAVIAQDIVGVQGMQGPAGQIFNIKADRRKFLIVDQTIDKLPSPPKGYLTVDVVGEVALWLEEQPIHLWKHGDVPAYSFGMERYTVSEELLTMLMLRFS